MKKKSLVGDGIFGLSARYDDASTIVIPVPWQATIVEERGADKAPQAILEASKEIARFDAFYPTSWRQGIYMLPVDTNLQLEGGTTRKMVSKYLKEENEEKKAATLQEINRNCQKMVETVKRRSRAFLQEEKTVVSLGGSSATSLGHVTASSEFWNNFGVLQIDAHANLRHCYQNIRFSHPSTTYNILELPQVSSVVQIGLTDIAEAEVEEMHELSDRLHPFLLREIQQQLFEGTNWKTICKNIASYLPKQVFILFDVDALQPQYCPNSALQATGGLGYEETFYLLETLVNAGTEFIGASLTGVGTNCDFNTDSRIAAKILYRLCNLVTKSQSESNSDSKL